jgi:dienelactone hydrolase
MLHQEGIPMNPLTSTRFHSKSSRAIVAGAVLTLMLSAPTGAFAQSSPPAANTAVAGPKQVGAWTVTGWSQGYCSAERPVRGADGGASVLQFVLARLRIGYRLALSAQEWELTPQTSFPVELIADPVLRSQTQAVAGGPKLVIIELGTDGDTVKKLATASTLDVKTARTTFKLPMEGFAQSLAEVDACYGGLKQPVANPFAAPAGAPKQPVANPFAAPEGTPKQTTGAPKSETPRAAEAPAPAPKKTMSDSTPSAPSAKYTTASAPAAAPSKVNLDDGLVAERTFLTVPDKTPYRLEALVVRPAKANGRLPIALITHGKNANASENQSIRADLMLPQARDLAARGWLAVVVIRRGFGQSDGFPGISRGSAYMSCENADLVRGFDVEADDLAGALQALATRSDADPTRVIAIGQSLGGGTVLAFAARQPKGLLGVVNVSGGVWRTNGNGACDTTDLVEAMSTFGSRTRVPTLWLYAENDSLFPPALVAQMRDAYTLAGGRAKLRMFPPVLGDGHALFADFGGRVKWLRALDVFLRDYRMPDLNAGRVDQAMATIKLPPSVRPVVEEYVSAPGPKLLVVTASGKGAYWVANPTDIEGARKRVLTNCKEKSGDECTVVMENNELARPIITGAITPESSTR